MVRCLSVENALREIEAIERLISPYKYSAYEATRVLQTLKDLKEALNKMDKEKIKQIMEDFSSLENAAAPYRGYRFVEEALQHAKKLHEELNKIVSN